MRVQGNLSHICPCRTSCGTDAPTAGEEAVRQAEGICSGLPTVSACCCRAVRTLTQVLLYPKSTPLSDHRRVLICKSLFFLLLPFLQMQDLYCGYLPKCWMTNSSLRPEVSLQRAPTQLASAVTQFQPKQWKSIFKEDVHGGMNPD